MEQRLSRLGAVSAGKGDAFTAIDAGGGWMASRVRLSLLFLRRSAMLTRTLRGQLALQGDIPREGVEIHP